MTKTLFESPVLSELVERRDRSFTQTKDPDAAASELSTERGQVHLFLTCFGEPFSPNALSRLVLEYIERAAIGKRGSCHLFRHTMATLMLEGGADVRFIQAMLGHSSLSTTEIYTQVSIKQLKAVHNAAHPAAHLKGRDEPTS